MTIPLPGRPRLLRELPICLLLAGIVVVAYFSVWHFDFVYFEDPGYVTDNLTLASWAAAVYRFQKLPRERLRAFSTFEQGNWHPLTWLSHMLDVQIYGPNAPGHHVTNIIFHVMNTVLLFWLLRWTTGRVWPSAAVAAFLAYTPCTWSGRLDRPAQGLAEHVPRPADAAGVCLRYFWKPNLLWYCLVFVLFALDLMAMPMLIISVSSAALLIRPCADSTY